MRKFFVVALCLALALGGYLSVSTVEDTTSVATAASGKYKGTIYVAGMGGHFAEAQIEINPGAETPITVTNLDRVVIGNGKTHPVHDARIDGGQMYYSTYKIDKEGPGNTMHVGVVDLKSKAVEDHVVEIDKSVKWNGALYCASGQTDKSFIPVTMTNPAYIDVFAKKGLKHKERVFLDSLGYDNNYFFYHGTNSPDGKKFFVTINMTDKWAKPDAPAGRKGVVENVMLDLPDLEKGKVTVLAKGVATGDPAKTLTFRQSFTPDGKYILQSGADRMYLIDANTLDVVDEEIMMMGENHDVVTTPDGKYGILTLRSGIEVKIDPEDKGTTIKDGMIALYDIEAKQVVGKATSVCYACHGQMGLNKNAVLCGADVTWK